MKLLHFLPLAVVLAGCAGNQPPKLPYPAFVQVDEMADGYIATLPGATIKPLATDMRTRATSSRVDLPPDWNGTTASAPGLETEMFVLAGELVLSDFVLRPGGYAYIPPGSLGFRMRTDTGARILHFHNTVDENAVIRAPILVNSDLVDWADLSPGIRMKVLRNDPGSGATVGLWLIEPGASFPLSESTVAREGYMIAGDFWQSECHEGEPQTAQYLPGGYFLRPVGAVSGGPDTRAVLPTTWFLREPKAGTPKVVATCPPPVED